MALEDYDVVAVALAASDRIQRLDFILACGRIGLEPRTKAILREARAQQIDHLSELDSRIKPEPTDFELRATERRRQAALPARSNDAAHRPGDTAV